MTTPISQSKKLRLERNEHLAMVPGNLLEGLQALALGKKGEGWSPRGEEGKRLEPKGQVFFS